MTDREKVIKGLKKIAEFFKARGDMAVGDGKMLLLSWMRAAEDAIALLEVQEPIDGDTISRSALLAAYDAAHKGPPGGARKLIEEAPAVVLKAQEPRVMTLEEVKALQPDTDIWIEVRYLNAPIRIRACTVSGFSPGGTRLFIIGGAHNYPMDMYNNYFRCWTSRPTEEQREATPWND